LGFNISQLLHGQTQVWRPILLIIVWRVTFSNAALNRIEVVNLARDFRTGLL